MPRHIISIQELKQQQIQYIDKLDSTFDVNSKLILSVENNLIHYTIINTEHYQKRYPIEAIDYSNYIDNPNQKLFLASIENVIAGQVRLRQNWNNYCYIEDLVVDSKFRRMGIGKTLIQAAIDWAKGKRYAGIMLETQNNNVAACLFYSSCGFELAGFDKRLYRGLDPNTEEIALYWYLIFKR